MERKIIEFVEKTLNDNNQYSNAASYFDGVYGDYEHVIIQPEKNHRQIYFKIMEFCLTNNLIIVKTDLLNYGVTVRFERGRWRKNGNKSSW